MEFIIGGDFNVIPEDKDCYDPKAWAGDALAQPESRAAFLALQHLGLYEAFRLLNKNAGEYTFWDYQGGAFNKDHGIRIDHLLCSPQAADRLSGVEIFRKARAMTKPSDHVPVIGTFSD